jgi:hypothetical protein
VRVEKIGPGGPIQRQGFDEAGNYYVVYESGAGAWFSAELIERETAEAMPLPPTPEFKGPEAD